MTDGGSKRDEAGKQLPPTDSDDTAAKSIAAETSTSPTTSAQQRPRAVEKPTASVKSRRRRGSPQTDLRGKSPFSRFAPAPPFKANTFNMMLKGGSRRPRSPAHDSIKISIQSIMTSGKCPEVVVAKSATVAVLKNLIKNKTKIKKFVVFYKDKELKPDDSILTSHGMTNDCSVRVHVKTQSGTSDKEDINSLLQLNRSIQDIKALMVMTMSDGPPRTKEKAVPLTDPEENSGASQRLIEAQKQHENSAAREKMSKLREQLKKRRKADAAAIQSPRSPHRQRKPRGCGGVAGEYLVTARTQSDEESRSPVMPEPSVDLETSVSMSNVGGAALNLVTGPNFGKTGPVTRKEMLLAFSPPESVNRHKKLQHNFFEPPDSREKLAALHKEYQASRCAYCNTKIKLAMQAMSCRCAKVYCEEHRPTLAHCCAVDLKTVDRQKLAHSVKKATGGDSTADRHQTDSASEDSSEAANSTRAKLTSEDSSKRRLPPKH